MENKRKSKRNGILLALVVLGFAAVAFAVLNSMNLTEYEGSLKENVSYQMPAGYEFVKDSKNTDPDTVEYIRNTDKSKEYITIWYNGMTGRGDYEDADKCVKIDENTKCNLCTYDWSNDRDNELICEIMHDEEAYVISYKCQNKDGSYSSCSEKQQNEILVLAKSFDYHRPSNEAGGNVFQRLYHNYGVAGLVLLGLTVLIFVGFPIGIAIGSLIGRKEEDETIISSKDLLNDVNRDRENRGESALPSINTVQGVSTNTLARKDKSWSSVPDFFVKMFKHKDKKGENI